MSSSRPVVAVLCSDADDRPHLDALADRMDLRFAEETGLVEGLRGAQVLFLWDFSSAVLRDA